MHVKTFCWTLRGTAIFGVRTNRKSVTFSPLLHQPNPHSKRLRIRSTLFVSSSSSRPKSSLFGSSIAVFLNFKPSKWRLLGLSCPQSDIYALLHHCQKCLISMLYVCRYVRRNVLGALTYVGTYVVMCMGTCVGM